jgi:hypothetical protein
VPFQTGTSTNSRIGIFWEFEACLRMRVQFILKDRQDFIIANLREDVDKQIEVAAV